MKSFAASLFLAFAVLNDVADASTLSTSTLTSFLSLTKDKVQTGDFARKLKAIANGQERKLQQGDSCANELESAAYCVLGSAPDSFDACTDCFLGDSCSLIQNCVKTNCPSTCHGDIHDTFSCTLQSVGGTGNECPLDSVYEAEAEAENPFPLCDMQLIKFSTCVSSHWNQDACINCIVEAATVDGTCDGHCDAVDTCANQQCPTNCHDELDGVVGCIYGNYMSGCSGLECTSESGGSTATVFSGFGSGSGGSSGGVSVSSNGGPGFGNTDSFNFGAGGSLSEIDGASNVNSLRGDSAEEGSSPGYKAKVGVITSLVGAAGWMLV